MSDSEKYTVKIQIEQIIERSRHQDEMFLIDSKTAAAEILIFLQNEHMLFTDKNEGN